jgi:YVTN family beta-propeller protein
LLHSIGFAFGNITSLQLIQSPSRSFGALPGEEKMRIRLLLLALADLRASCFAALWGMLAMGLGVMAWPGEALAWTGQPLVYVTGSDGISVIDTGDNEVVDTIPVFATAAVTPDGKRVYALGGTSDISVIDTTNDKVVATIPLDVALVQDGVSLNGNSSAIAVTPDGKYVYATTGLCSMNSFDCFRPESVYFAVWVIDTATNVVTASYGKGIADWIAFTPDGQHTYLANFDPYTVLPQVLVFDTGNVISLPGSGAVFALAITPDGRHAYVPYVLFDNGEGSENVAIIDTASNTVMKTIPIGTVDILTKLTGVAVTPDGKHVYVANQGGNSVSVIDTAINTVVKTVLVGTSPSGVAVTPDGKHVYVANQGSNGVSVIDTASNTVVATVPVAGPSAISIIPPPQGIPFLAFNARLDVNLGRNPNQAAFDLGSSFILNSTASNGIHPDTEPVKLQVGPFIATIPSGSFRRRGDRSYTFEGVIDGVRLEAKIELRGGFRYAFHAEVKGANLSGTTNPVQVSLGIGNDAGLTSVKADFDRDHQAHHWTDYWR